MASLGLVFAPDGQLRAKSLLVALGQNPSGERVDHVVGAAALDLRGFDLIVDVPAVVLERREDLLGPLRVRQRAW